MERGPYLEEGHQVEGLTRRDVTGEEWCGLLRGDITVEQIWEQYPELAPVPAEPPKPGMRRDVGHPRRDIAMQPTRRPRQ